jgi:hypothetical protein
METGLLLLTFFLPPSLQWKIEFPYSVINRSAMAYYLHVYLKQFGMPWYNGDYPPSYKNQPPRLREKAVEIANLLLEEGTPEGIAIATGLKRAREYFLNKAKKNTGQKQAPAKARKIDNSK